MLFNTTNYITIIEVNCIKFAIYSMDLYFRFSHETINITDKQNMAKLGEEAVTEESFKKDLLE